MKTAIYQHGAEKGDVADKGGEKKEYAKKVYAVNISRDERNGNMKYRKKPVVIEAFCWTGDIDQSEDPEWIVKAVRSGKARIMPGNYMRSPYMIIETLEEEHIAWPGDYIIQGVAGELYPCKPNIFLKTYEEVK